MCKTFEKAIKSKRRQEANQQFKIYLPTTYVRYQHYIRQIRNNILRHLNATERRPTFFERLQQNNAAFLERIIEREANLNRMADSIIEDFQTRIDRVGQERAQEIENIRLTGTVVFSFTLCLVSAIIYYFLIF